MKNLFWFYTFILFLVINLTSCVSPKVKEIMANGTQYKPLNLLPMYGAEYEPYIKKTEEQKENDQKFIASIIKSEGSRKVGAKRFSAAGWLKLKNGDAKTAMMRFNQAWLLDPDYYQPYWGFGALMLNDKNPEKAIIYFEKAIKRIDSGMIDEVKEKPSLFVDAARAYAWQAAILKESNTKESTTLYGKANKLIDDALNINPMYGNAYRIGGIIAYEEGNYERALSIVKKSRNTGAYDFDAKFISKLSQKMSEP